jgi:hypothetical protein
MYRRHIILGVMAASFGAGILLTSLIPAGVLLFLFALVLIFVGIILLK